MSVYLSQVDVDEIIAFLECLVYNQCCVCVIANYMFALKVNFFVYSLSFDVLPHPKIHHFVKLLKINRTLNVTPHIINDIDIWLESSKSVKHCI